MTSYFTLIYHPAAVKTGGEKDLCGKTCVLSSKLEGRRVTSAPQYKYNPLFTLDMISCIFRPLASLPGGEPLQGQDNGQGEEGQSYNEDHEGQIISRIMGWLY